MLRILNYTIAIYIWNQAGKHNSIMSSNTLSWTHQLLSCICLSERAYFNYIDDRLSIWTTSEVVRRKHIQPTLPIMGWRGCTSAMGAIKHPSSCSSLSCSSLLCKQFLYYYICSRGVFGINHFKLRKFAVVAIECFCNSNKIRILTRIHRCSVMIYGSPEAEFMETKHNGHIHGYNDIGYHRLKCHRNKNRVNVIHLESTQL